MVDHSQVSLNFADWFLEGGNVKEQGYLAAAFPVQQHREIDDSWTEG